MCRTNSHGSHSNSVYLYWIPFMKNCQWNDKQSLTSINLFKLVLQMKTQNDRYDGKMHILSQNELKINGGRASKNII